MLRTGAKVDDIEGSAMATSKDPRGGGSLGHSTGSASVWLCDVDRPLAFSGLRLPSWKISMISPSRWEDHGEHGRSSLFQVLISPPTCSVRPDISPTTTVQGAV